MLARTEWTFTLRQTWLAALYFTFSTSAVLFVEPAPYDLLTLLLLVAALAQSLLVFSPRVRLPVFFLLIFVGSNLISTFAMQSVPRGLFYLAVTLYLVASWVFFVGIVSRYQLQALRTIFSGYIVAALISSLCGMLALAKVLPPVYPLLFAGRISGLFKDPNVFGPFLVVASLFALLKLETTTALRTRATWLGILCFLLIGILLSFSRAAWLNCAASFGIYILFSEKINFRRLLSIGLAFFLVITLVVVYFAYNPSAELTFTQRLKLQDYDSERFENQAAALSESSINPLGFGVGQSEVLLARATHSLYLRILFENGWFGLLAFVGFIGVTFVRSLNLVLTTTGTLRKYHLLFFAAITGVLVNSLVIDSLHWRHFWFLLALPWAIYED